MDFMSKKKVAWITGGGTGIGSELCKILTSKDWNVIISGRRLNKLKEIQKFDKQKITPLKLDISSKLDCENVKEKILKKFQNLDLIFLNAAAYNPGHLNIENMEIVKNVIDINLIGQMNCLSAVISVFRKQGSGHIVFVSSPAGYRGLPNAGVYGVSKSAITFLAESLYIEMLGSNIKVQVVNPGFVKTPMTDKNKFKMPFLMSAKDAAQRIYKKLSSKDFEIYFPKRLIIPMKILQILPNKIYFYIMKKITKFSQ